MASHDRPRDRLNRGLAALRVGGHEEALLHLDGALALDPQLAPALGARGVALGLLGRNTEALESFDAALAIDPGHVATWNNRANALAALGRVPEAVECYDRALEIEPSRARAWQNRAVALRRLDRHTEALESLDRALRLEPEACAPWSEHGVTLREMGRYADSAASFAHALAACPSDPQARFNHGVLQLLLGQMPEGWDAWEARQELPMLGTPRSSAPSWDGKSSLAGRRILLLAEQGLGDTIQFCRYAGVLAAQGARVAISVQPPLHRLLRTLEGVDLLVSDTQPPPTADFACGLLSLPQRLRTTLATIPHSIAYLAPAPLDVDRWSQRLGARRVPRIGLAVSGNPKHAFDHRRSIPLASFAPLSTLDCELHLLQAALPAADVPWLARLAVADHRDRLADFGETAALAACMDAVVSVDTAVAHLAGALGLTVHLLLAASPDWRWLLDRGDSPWYPSARLYRQVVSRRWDEPMARVCEALRERLA
jgi:Tfp pilus assembly protein PilF